MDKVSTFEHSDRSPKMDRIRLPTKTSGYRIPLRKKQTESQNNFPGQNSHP
jgi:hypothetical protein